MAIIKGTCKWFNSEKGFGFISPDDGSADVFVHQSQLKSEGYRSLAEESRVEFQLETDERTGKVKAVEVTGPNGSNVQGVPRSGGGGYGGGGYGGGYN